MTAATAPDARSAPSVADGVGQALARLEAILQRALVRAGTPSDDPFRGLHLGPDDLGRILAHAPGAPLFAAAGPAAALPDATPEGARLTLLARGYGLEAFEVDALLIALGPELDLRYERIYAYLQDDVTRKRPTVNLVLDLLCTSTHEKLARRAHFLPGAPLRRHRLILALPDAHDSEPPLLARPLRADEQIVRFVLDEAGLDARLTSFCRLVRPPAQPAPAALDPALQRRFDALVVRAVDEAVPLVLCLHGRDERACLRAAEALAARAGASLLAADLAADMDPDAMLPIVFREARMHGAVLLLEGWETLRAAGRPAATRRFLSLLAEAQGIVVLAGERAWTPGARGPRGVMSLEVDVPAYAARRTAWVEHVAESGLSADGATIDALAGRFRLGIDQIVDAVVTARQLAAGSASRPGSAGDELFAAARMQSGHDMAALATKIVPRNGWGDLVLPDDAITQLRELCARSSLAHRVLGDWGFDRRLALGKGVTALFAGPSGTGKTMAAEVIANALGLDLYRIDLSAVVSKWIGETEKNLDRLFRAADNAILFFDEADALFGKRSEVRDAHDRYANVEISYLLQKMESHEGVAILATNLRNNLDEAFLRRLAFVVYFPFPDAGQRRRIWARIWPAETPLGDDVDLDRLATMFALTGGHVKNIALAAAFEAAARDAPVTMADVLHAARREYQKLGRDLSADELAAPGRR
jgi:hypothetical protein